MKRKAIYILLLLVALVSCQEDVTGEWASTEVVFSTGNVATVVSRVNGSGWEPSTDRIGIYMVETSETLAATTIVEGADNKKYRPSVTAANATLAADGDDQVIYYPQTGSVDFIAYYPWLATGTSAGQINNYQYPVDITDQAAAAGILVSRNATGKSKTTPSVALELKPALSKLVMTLKAGNGVTTTDLANISAVTLTAPLTANYALADGTVTSVGSNASASLGGAQETSGVYTVEAVVLPGTGTGRKITFTLPESAGSGSVTWSIPDEIDFAGGTQYNYTITLSRTSATATIGGISAWDNTTNLTTPEVTHSSWSNPNCYMITSGTTADIPIAKAYDMWRYHPYFRDTEASLSGTPTAELLWMDTEGLITSVDIVNPGYSGALMVYTGDGKTGNAVVAVKIGGEIRWSWHIWVSAYKPYTSVSLASFPGQHGTANTYVYAYDNNEDGNSDLIFMDRNLGAGSNTVGDATAKGLYYQWGRKDPFVGTIDWSHINYTPMYDLSGEITAGLTNGIPTIAPAAGSIANVPAAVVEANKMYVGVSNPWGSDAGDLWGHNAAKSPFDPCPAGWRVPSYDSAKSTSPWEGLIAGGVWDRGYDFGTLLGYYPAASRRSDYSGALSSVSTQGCYWSASLTVGNFGGYLYFVQNDVTPNSTLVHGAATSVRCAKI